MRCPKCSSLDTAVIDTRGDEDAIRRRRECQSCSFRFTTYERIELSLPMIIKKGGAREPFDRNKLKAGIVRACEKRPVSVEEIDRVVDKVEKRVSELCLKEIPSMQIGDFLMEELKNLDQIAYVRFASVYREFSDISQFTEALDTLKRKVSQKNAKKEKVLKGLSKKVVGI